MSRLDGNDPVSTAFDAFVLDQDVLAIFILINPKSKFSCFFSHNDKFTEFTKKITIYMFDLCHVGHNVQSVFSILLVHCFIVQMPTKLASQREIS